MTNKEPKYLTDFFLYKKKYHWFIIPTIIYFYRKDLFFLRRLCIPQFGLSIRWLTFFMGIQFQVNPYYKK